MAVQELTKEETHLVSGGVSMVPLLLHLFDPKQPFASLLGLASALVSVVVGALGGLLDGLLGSLLGGAKSGS